MSEAPTKEELKVKKSKESGDEASAASAWVASASAWVAAASAAAAADTELSLFAEEVVQILIAMKAPGTEWLDLTETA